MTLRYIIGEKKSRHELAYETYCTYLLSIRDHLHRILDMGTICRFCRSKGKIPSTNQRLRRNSTDREILLNSWNTEYLMNSEELNRVQNPEKQLVTNSSLLLCVLGLRGSLIRNNQTKIEKHGRTLEVSSFLVSSISALGIKPIQVRWGENTIMRNRYTSKTLIYQLTICNTIAAFPFHWSMCCLSRRKKELLTAGEIIQKKTEKINTNISTRFQTLQSFISFIG